jgi:hypothetical protein
VRIGGADAGETAVTPGGDGGSRTGLAIVAVPDGPGYVVVTDQPGERYRIP